MPHLFPVKTVSIEDLDALVDELEHLGSEDFGADGSRSSPSPSPHRSSFLISRSGSMSAILNLVCSTLGASVLALPHAFARSGILWATVLLAVCGGLTVFSSYLLVRISELTGAQSYETIARRLFGHQERRMVESVMILFCFGVGVGYVVAVRDTLVVFQSFPHCPALFRGPGGLRVMTTCFWAVTMLPLSFAKRVSTLRYASLGSVVGVGYTATLIVAHTAMRWLHRVEHHRHHFVHEKNIHWVVLFNGEMLLSIPIIMFAYCCQPNVLDVYRALRDGDSGRMRSLTGVAITSCTCIYIITGAAGYIDWGNKVKGNVLSMFDPRESYFISAGFVSILCALASAFPLCMLPTRAALTIVVEEETIRKHHFLITLGLSSAALVLGLYSSGIVAVFGFLGGFCGSLIGFIIPALFALRLNLPANNSEVALTWILLVFGIVAGTIGTWTSLFTTA